MRLALLTLELILALGIAAGQEHYAMGPGKPATLLPGLGNHHHPIRTSNPEAQRFFDQWLKLDYAFNHEEAARSFRRAAPAALPKPGPSAPSAPSPTSSR